MLKKYNFIILILSLLIVGLYSWLHLAEARTLNPLEVTQLEWVFDKNVNYEKIKLFHLPLPSNMGAFVIGNRIFYQDDYYRDDFSNDVMKMSLLVHETAHVWVNQQRGILASFKAIGEHLLLGQEVYAINDLKLETKLEDVGIEKQARIFSQYFLNKQFGFEQPVIEKIVQRAVRPETSIEE